MSVLKLAYYDDEKIEEKAIQEYARVLNMPGGKYALLKTAKQIDTSDTPQLTSKYRDINVPTLIIWGREDEVIPLSIGERLQREIPGSKMVVLEECGHIPQEEKPVETLKIISEFLSAEQSHR